MKCKVNRNAAKVMKTMLENEDAQGQMLRVIVTENHGDHAHYALTYGVPTEHDEIVSTDKGIDVLLDKREALLDGVWIQFFYVPEPGFEIINPSKGDHNHF
ncbi:MAG: iron-sulfur cluster assembly accessory protein [Sporolactobacillus sp.]